MGAGSLKSVTGTPASAAFMNRCHAEAGNEPPVRLRPLMVNFSPTGGGGSQPTNTAVESVGV